MSVGGKVSQTDIHDSYARECSDLDAERRAHSPNLMFFAFGQSNPKSKVVQNFYFAFLGYIAFNIYSRFHKIGRAHV